MALAERDRRALIVFGSIVVVALAAYFLLLKPKGGDGTVSSGATSGPFTTGPIGTTAPPSVAPSTPPVTPPTPPPRARAGRPRRRPSLRPHPLSRPAPPRRPGCRWEGRIPSHPSSTRAAG